MNKTTKIILLAVLGIIVIGGLSYGGYRLFKKEGLAQNGNSQNEIRQISHFPYIPFEDIQLSETVPLFSNSIVDEKLRGKNSVGQDADYFHVSLLAKKDIEEISHFYLDELPKNSWNIQSNKIEDCSSRAQPCNKWHKINASSNEQELEFFIISPTDYEITIFYGEQRSVLLNLPSDFPSELIQKEVKIKMFLRGFNDKKERKSLLELENFSDEKLRKLLPDLEKLGWIENCGCASSPGFFNCGCSKQTLSFDFGIQSGDFYDKDKTILKVTEK